MNFFGWRLLDNYGNYGVYGWALNIFRVQNDIVFQFGPWKTMVRHG